MSRPEVEGGGGTSSIKMTELLVRTTLPDFGKAAEMLQNRSCIGAPT